MWTKHGDRHGGSAQQGRIDQLKQRAALAAGGEMVVWESDELQPDGDALRIAR